MRSRKLPGTTFAVRFPENNNTPQNVRQPIRFKHSTAHSINVYKQSSVHSQDKQNY